MSIIASDRPLAYVAPVGLRVNCRAASALEMLDTTESLDIFPKIENASNLGSFSNSFIDREGFVTKDLAKESMEPYAAPPDTETKESEVFKVECPERKYRYFLSDFAKGRRTYYLFFSHEEDPELDRRVERNISIQDRFACIYGSERRWVVTVIRNDQLDSKRYDDVVERTIRLHHELRWESSIAPIKAYYKGFRRHWIVQHYYPDGTLKQLLNSDRISKIETLNLFYLVFDVWNGIEKLHKKELAHNKINTSAWIVVKDPYDQFRIKLGDLWYVSQDGDMRDDIRAALEISKSIIFSRFAGAKGRNLLDRFSKVAQSAEALNQVARQLLSDFSSRTLDDGEESSAKRAKLNLVIPVESKAGEEKADDEARVAEKVEK